MGHVTTAHSMNTHSFRVLVRIEVDGSTGSHLVTSVLSV